MKKLGKVLKIAFYCMFTMICLFTISIPVVNNLTAKGVENHLKKPAAAAGYGACCFCFQSGQINREWERHAVFWSHPASE